MPPPGDNDSAATMLFSVGKKELLTFTSGLKSLQRRLRANWKLATYVSTIQPQLHCLITCLFAQVHVHENFMAFAFVFLALYSDSTSNSMRD
jgi:hypothetical protein